MLPTFRWSRAARRLCCAPILLSAILGAVSVSSRRVQAHPLLGDCIQHRVHLRVGPANIDIEIELMLTDLRAMAERRRMDTDRDGEVSAEEAEQYTRKLMDRVADQVELTINGRPVPLATLYDPELDLLEHPQVMPLTHIVRLFFFARTPAYLQPGSELVVADDLWPETPAVLAMAVTGQEGVQIATTATDPFALAAAPDARRELRAHCTAVPAEGIHATDPPRTMVVSAPTVPTVYPYQASSWPAIGGSLLTIWILTTVLKRLPRRAT